ncbi:hypothetical protein [Fibrobacter sp. UWH4]|uniref:hypothetical protein n=1 Tax=Fibrobacter sp. UWH4 TaxID=1896210 RepID=UPI000916CEE8|nr:hypothetical protein [Fibrobacter sp. UWH4]SHK32078.1 hypothetical protein SAMN05720762_101358 [Fibrobacter sp. UWH4]
MASLSVSINLLSNNTFVKTSNDIKLLNSELGKTGGVLDSLKNKIDLSQKLTGLASASTLFSNFTSGVKRVVEGFGLIGALFGQR